MNAMRVYFCTCGTVVHSNVSLALVAVLPVMYGLNWWLSSAQDKKRGLLVIGMVSCSWTTVTNALLQ